MFPNSKQTAQLLGLALTVNLWASCRTRTANETQHDQPSQPIDAAPAQQTPPSTSPVRILYPAAPGSFVSLHSELAPSVVHLRSTTKVRGGPGSLVPGNAGSHALGSGFILDRKGLIVTNEHIIATAPSIEVVLQGGSTWPATVVGRDSKLDLALLKIQAPASDLKPVRLGDSELLAVGEWVLALGNPLGSEVTASAGIVSAKGTSDRDASITGVKTNYHGFMRTDAIIDVGNSGGPLVDTTGAVVGISSASLDAHGEMHFVIPINRAQAILPMLEKNGKATRAWLGVFVHPVTRQIAKERHLKTVSGALVSEVVPASPAALAGILPGDVIVKFDGNEVDHRTLPWLAATAQIGKPVALQVWRSDQPRTLTLRSQRMPQ